MTHAGSSQPARVQLLFFPGCPHAEEARESIRAALDTAGLDGAWIEWDVSAPTTPKHLRGYGSPTVLVDATDVLGSGSEVEGTACRVGGAPSPAEVLAALRSG